MVRREILRSSLGYDSGVQAVGVWRFAMSKDDRDIFEVLKAELSFLEDGGYGRSPHKPWRASLIFEDSPTCLNFNDSDRPNPCTDCLLTEFVPAEHQSEHCPCLTQTIQGIESERMMHN
jgi:hypothetical protein